VEQRVYLSSALAVFVDNILMYCCDYRELRMTNHTTPSFKNGWNYSPEANETMAACDHITLEQNGHIPPPYLPARCSACGMLFNAEDAWVRGYDLLERKMIEL
jgi:hypothetical protein